jgi:hypothetical protein
MARYCEGQSPALYQVSTKTSSRIEGWVNELGGWASTDRILSFVKVWIWPTRQCSDHAIQFTADTIGEADPVLSMTAFQAAAKGGLIIDKTGPLAKLAAKR